MAAYYGSIGRVSTGGGSRLEQILWPNGACGYRDLGAGAHAPTCGCRRFWLNTGHTVAGNGEIPCFCACGHHACFHDFVNHASVVGNVNAAATSQHQPAQIQSPNPPFNAPTWSQLIREPVVTPPGTGVQDAAATNRPTTGLGIRDASQPDSINVRLWDALNGFARQQDGSNPSSHLPSTAVPSVADDGSTAGTRPAPSNQQHAGWQRLMGPPVTIPQDQPYAIQNGQHSATEVATEVATPSVRFGTPDLRAVTTQVPVARSSTPLDQPRLQREQGAGQSLRQSVVARQEPAPASESSQPRRPSPRPTSAGPSLSIQEMCNTIQNYGRRLSILEQVSFNNLPSDEVHNQFELMDGRVLDLEQWRTEQEKIQEIDDTEEQLQVANERLDDLESWRTDYLAAQIRQKSDSPEASSSRRKHILSSSFESDGSFDLNAAAQTEAVVLATIAANAETGPRIDALESRLSELESAALPSFARPWSIEIVLLPFGRQLPGVWFTPSESTQHSIRTGTQVTEEWSAAIEAPKASFTSEGDAGAWTTTSIEAWANSTQDEWLSPKACGPTGTVFQRLASRGFVHDVEIYSPDAGHILSVISEALDGVLNDQASIPSTMNERYQGLRERFVPLRKVRKSSRLRFLSTSEMVTSSAWSAAFLDSSVFMKTNGERRLYLTTPEGYLQPARPGWSWKMLRDLPMYDSDGELQNAQATGRIVEACWTFHDRLDVADSLQTSFHAEDSPWEPSQNLAVHQDNDETVNDPTAPPAQRGYRDRSISFPDVTSAQAVDLEPLPKRPVASFAPNSPSKAQEEAAQSNSKRRRISSSPELDRRGYNFTPRYSREPPSPFTSDDICPGRSSQAASSRARGTTPFAYATPHSHFDSRGGDCDTEADDDLPLAHSENGDWEGLPDGPTTSPVVSVSEGNRNEDIDNRLYEDNHEQGLAYHMARLE